MGYDKGEPRKMARENERRAAFHFGNPAAPDGKTENSPKPFWGIHSEREGAIPMYFDQTEGFICFAPCNR